MMRRITAADARKRLDSILDEIVASHEPVQITGKRKNAILVSEEDWRAIRDTLYLSSIPGMKKSIQRGMKLPVEKCLADPEW